MANETAVDFPFICLCCPGMYNALTGLGGSGQVNYSNGSRECQCRFNLYNGGNGAIRGRADLRPCLSATTANCAFAIDASFIWVAQGAMRTTYVPESQKGRAVAAF
ncbi:hypothetical protein PENDEC_c025G06530 [Penicillium decumbens]|uniref:Cyanovirin-N domain-containing protein n=1 Tax=Penicillium decumbens TaxID=69771 RepID=A0A1V6NZV5_PENDC|nr:hypothetical protein PENDEC_c025G06530 [Penicillium decumbens]